MIVPVQRCSCGNYRVTVVLGGFLTITRCDFCCTYRVDEYRRRQT